MKTIRAALAITGVLLHVNLYSQSTLVPLPVEQTMREGTFLFDRGTRIVAGEGAEDLVPFARDRLRTTATPVAGGTIVNIGYGSRADLPAEGYRIEVTPGVITLEAGDRRGLVWGIETLSQLLSDEQQIPCQTITDYPRFAHRGMHLDVARTFSDKNTVLRYIDNMARHKLNTLHWHLTDDEGWRIEIESYPRLTQVGGWRGGESLVRSVYGAWNESYGGFFTQDEVREVVAYAADRGIEIIPEIDLPGHSRAAAKAYPEILCAGAMDTSAAGHDLRNVWCATHDANFAMLDTILGEVAALFQSEYVHVGGDEVEPGQWEVCPTCGPLLRKHGAGYVNGQFMARLDTILQRHGKRQAVWNEAVAGGNLPLTATVYGWENLDVCKQALREGYRTVLMPSQYFYLDMRQGQGEPGLTWAGTVDLQKIYSFEPASLGLTETQQERIAGVEGALWTETLLEYGPRHVEYQLYPRVCAIAEVAWSPAEARNFADFNRRLVQHHLARLTEAGIGFRIEPPVVKVLGATVTAIHHARGTQIRYTDDGTEPDSLSELYTGPLPATGRKTYRFRAFLGSGYSRVADVPGTQSRLITPKVTLTGSLAQAADNPFSNGVDYKGSTYARTRSTCRPGDWFMWKFAAPVTCKSITVKTGYRHMQRFVVPLGVLEVSYNGVDFEVVEPQFVRTATFEPSAPVRALRLTATCPDNGEDSVVIQDLEIVAG